LYQSFMPTKKEIRFVRVTGMSIEILFSVTYTMSPFPTMGSLSLSKSAISFNFSFDVNAQLIVLF
jgi:hypothetical protein